MSKESEAGTSISDAPSSSAGSVLSGESSNVPQKAKQNTGDRTSQPVKADAQKLFDAALKGKPA